MSASNGAPSRRLAAALSIGISLAASAAVVASPGIGLGQPAPEAGAAGEDARIAQALTKRWDLAISRDEAQRRIDDAIGAVTRQMIPIVSSVANRRLRHSSPLSPWIDVSFPGDRIRVQFVDATFDTPANREIEMPYPGDPGTPLRVHQAIRGGALVQVFTTGDGRRWNTLTPSADGTTMTLDAVLRSSQLPSDVRYRIPYRAAR